MDQIALILMNVQIHKHVEGESALTRMEGMSANVLRILSYCNQVLLIELYCLYVIVAIYNGKYYLHIICIFLLIFQEKAALTLEQGTATWNTILVETDYQFVGET